MLIKTVTYKNFEDEEVTEQIHFHLTKAEWLELESSRPEGWATYVQALAEKNDNTGLLAVFKQLTLAAYGEKSADGKRFIKNEEMRQAFAASEAYSEIIFQVASDETVALEFFNGLVPKGLREEAEKNQALEAAREKALRHDG